MKKNVFFIGIILLTLGMSACNSQKNKAEKAAEIAFDGTYTGMLPCADCSGIQTTLELKKDMAYVMKTTYTGKSDQVNETRGKFEWNSKDNVITLDNKESNSFATKYMVGDNTLTQLDMDGNKITGEHADMYILRKVDNRLVEKYWKLTEIMGKPVEKAENMKEPHVIFKIDGNRVNGNGGCNNFMGTYQVESGDRIHFSKMASTMMACMHNMETEQQMHEVFEMADNYSINGDTLTLNKARMAPLARFEVVYLK